MLGTYFDYTMYVPIRARQWVKDFRDCMMFSFPTSLVSLRNAGKKVNIHSLYICIAGRSNSHDNNNPNNMEDPKRVLSYEDMLRAIKEPQKVIIDVREPDEVASTGKIPSSINIPLDTIEGTLESMSQEDFRCRFQREKPSTNDELVFYCKSGRRASLAMEKALKLGYKNSKNYLGSWSEWESKRK
ncbi:hypothetical protein PYW07_001513 [Mythimna separata]|uniref:Rhodanese domain-containing protein n=1 Tax=Mythimna separata TaxID=271217 RepID=A0AAD7YUI7_MYTSE|nr:hypothetical protein PYW07_001513 [Mythimna separata]